MEKPTVVCTICHEIQSVEEDGTKLDCESNNISCLEQGTNDNKPSISGTSVTTVVCTTTESNLIHDDDSEKGVPFLTLDSSQINISGLEDLNQLNHFENVVVNNSSNLPVRSIVQFYKPIHFTKSRTVVSEQSVINQTFLQSSTVVAIMNRRSWLAQPPLTEREYLENPAKYVIISDSATEEGSTRSENIYLVRTIQAYHIESKRINDIGYSFLIGSDGNVYEGRGWRVIGAHTFGYDNISVGIAFVGCFVNKLPPQAALTQAKALITHGVEMGYIDKEYRLVGHCQCRPFDSPGKQLYEEIKTWDNWYDLEVLGSD